MAFGSKKKAREEQALKDTALTTQTAATAPDEFEARQRARALRFDKWQSGESGPVNIHNMPDAGVPMALFKNAKAVSDAGRVGTGLGTMTEGANPNFVAARNQEAQMTRDTNASGMLEDYVDNATTANNAMMGNLAGIGNTRNMSLYQIAVDRLNNYERNKKPSFLKQLAFSMMTGAASAI